LYDVSAVNPSLQFLWYSILSSPYLRSYSVEFSTFIITYTAIAALAPKMTARPSTTFLKQEADDHLREIRRRKGIDGSDGEHNDNVGDLNRALDL
jgi:hypothetical protein